MKKITKRILEFIISIVIMETITILWNILLEFYKTFEEFIKYVSVGIVLPSFCVYGIFKIITWMGPEADTGMTDYTLVLFAFFIAILWISLSTKEFILHKEKAV